MESELTVGAEQFPCHTGEALQVLGDHDIDFSVQHNHHTHNDLQPSATSKNNWHTVF